MATLKGKKKRKRKKGLNCRKKNNNKVQIVASKSIRKVKIQK